MLHRRKFLAASIVGLFSLVFGKTSKAAPPPAAAKITEKDIMVEGKVTAVADYCENADKQPNRYCPKAVKGNTCAVCQFYSVKEEVTFKGKKYAKCQIVPNTPNYAAGTGTCATFVKRQG